MNVHEFVGQVFLTRPREWRLGQAYFNELYRINEPLANQLRGTAADPFYQDGNIPAFLSKLYLYYEAFGSVIDDRLDR